MPPSRLVLFDIDGTLIATGGAGFRAMTRALAAQWGLVDALQGIAVAGRTDSLILSEALARADVTDTLAGASFDAFVRTYCELLREELAGGHLTSSAPPSEGVDAGTTRPPVGSSVGVLPGVRELIDVLASRADVWIGLLTGNFAPSARIKLEHFGLADRLTWGAFGDDAVHRHELLPIALERSRSLGFATTDPAAIVVVGDTPHDVACARAGGARAVAVATGPFSREALVASGAEVVFDDLVDVAAFLDVLEA